MQLGQLDARLHAQRGVEVGQRLVKQKHLGLAHDGAADGHALALAAGQGLGFAVEQVRDLQNLGHLADGRAHLGFRLARQFEGKAHVVARRHVRIQGVALEDHGDAPLGRRHVVGQQVADVQLARADVFQSRDHAQQGRLAAAGRPDEDHEFAVMDIEVQALDDFRAVAVGLADAAQGNGGHVSAPRPGQRHGTRAGR